MDPNGNVIPFSELPEPFECSPKSEDFSTLVSIKRCSNMDAYRFDIIYKENPLILYFTGFNVASVLQVRSITLNDLD